MASASKKENQNIYILHTYPFKETSLIVEMLSKEFGRIAVAAKGARRPRSSLRGMLLPLQPLQATWSGLNELKTLHSIEWSDRFLSIEGDALICGFYLNELMMRLLPKDDPHPALYDHYHQAVLALSKNNGLSVTLRRFELRLLQELGYQVPLNNDIHGRIIDFDKTYIYHADSGPLEGKELEGSVEISGKTLIDMAADNYQDPLTEKQSKQLMRYLINHYIGDKPLHSKQLFMAAGE